MRVFIRFATFILCAVALLWAAPSQAQSQFPSTFMVTGVASDDVLNIRRGPSASTEIMASYGPFAIAVEVLEVTADGRWGMVGMGEGNGWVSMHYLAPTPPIPAGEIPRPLRCVGTEPFWSLTMFPRGDEYADPEVGTRRLTLISETVRPDGFDAVFEEGPTLNRSLTAHREACSDGMSDRQFGWSVVVSTDAPDGASIVRGCCTLEGNF